MDSILCRSCSAFYIFKKLKHPNFNMKFHLFEGWSLFCSEKWPMGGHLVTPFTAHELHGIEKPVQKSTGREVCNVFPLHLLFSLPMKCHPLLFLPSLLLYHTLRDRPTLGLPGPLTLLRNLCKGTCNITF